MVDLPTVPKQTYSVRLPGHIWEDITKIGAATKRSRSVIVEIALEDFIRKHGDVLSRNAS